MSANAVKVLLIEDNLAEARLLQEVLKESHAQQFELFHVQRLKEALQALDNASPYDAILLDLTLPDSQGLASLDSLLARAPNLPVVVLTNTNDDELALEAVRQGAQDYLWKRQINGDILVRSLRYAVERQQAREGLRQLLLGSLKNAMESQQTAVALEEVNHNLEIQAQKNLEELLKAKENKQLIAEFVSMISHDFKGPLTTILLSTGLLQTSGEKLTQDKKGFYFEMIRAAINNLNQMLDEVTVIGRADAGKFGYQLVPLDLEEFCYQLLEDLDVSAKSKNLTLSFLVKGVPQKGLWDAHLLRHILSNLLNNGIKYSSPDSSVVLELIYQPNTVIWNITDSGIGIPAEDREHLFQPFQRGSNVEQIPGTGLGLAIVKKCVDICGGQVTLESQEGQGTTFKIILPIIQKI
jgi:signal transduction histidine kinase